MPLIKDIIQQLVPLEYIGNGAANADKIVQLNDSSHENALLWCSDKNLEGLREVKSGTVILSAKGRSWVQSNIAGASFNMIVTDNPRKYFMNVLRNFYSAKVEMDFISDSASIDSSVVLQENHIYIGHNAVIEKDVVIGADCVIGHNTVILSGTKIGSNVKIGSNCTIGGAGFGYEKNDEGLYEQIPHLGNVIIEDDVEIGNNVAIDRAVIGNTILKKNVKIDNLVHIAHGVTIGENSLIIAHSMIAGSVQIGKNVWVAPASSIMQKIKIGDNSVIGMASNVLKDVEEGIVVVGNPAKKIR